jgi:hypothetical protein
MLVFMWVRFKNPLSKLNGTIVNLLLFSGLGAGDTIPGLHV